jgi:hypothetical protein
MRRLLMASGLLVALIGCSDPVRDAERELEIIEEAGGSKAEICAAERNVADAHLKAGNAQEYRTADLYADITCLNARLDPYGPISPEAQAIADQAAEDAAASAAEAGPSSQAPQP